MPDTAIKVAQRMLEALARADAACAGKELVPSASIGIAIADARYQQRRRGAARRRHRAVPRQGAGRKRFEMFDASLQKRAVDVLAMEGDLRVALQHDQFEPYFQPIVRLADGARWSATRR